MAKGIKVDTYADVLVLVKTIADTETRITKTLKTINRLSNVPDDEKDVEAIEDLAAGNTLRINLLTQRKLSLLRKLNDKLGNMNATQLHEMIEKIQPVVWPGQKIVTEVK